MDATQPAAPAAPPDRPPAAFTEKQTELLLDALKAGLAGPGEHRLFRWGKLGGLFPGRTGPSGETATTAVRDGLLAITRTEAKGRLVVEWVRVTPKGVAFVHDRDSPKAVLRELRAVLGAAVNGVPGWMEQARQDVAAASARFEQRAGEMLARLESLAARVEDALRRAEAAAPALSEPMAKLVPWGVAALEYLDRRKVAGAADDCRLSELFDALAQTHPDLTLPAFQDGLRRLAETRAVRLAAGDVAAVSEPEFAFVADGKLVWGVAR
jgi:hypothetical protein